MAPLILRLLVLAIAFTSTGLGADAVVGTWKLNLKKSRYNPGPAPKSQVRQYEGVPEGIRTLVTTVNAKGATTKAEYPANLDDKEYPVYGNPDIDHLSMHKVDDRTAEAKLKHGDRVLATVLRVISPDGKTMTIAYQGRDEYGDVVQYTAVFDKD